MNRNALAQQANACCGGRRRLYLAVIHTRLANTLHAERAVGFVTVTSRPRHAAVAIPIALAPMNIEKRAPAVPPTGTITIRRHGPYVVTGGVRVLREDGTSIREAAQVALCRCGFSREMPFCDGSHVAMAWRTED